ncbi:MAG: hypothetical protein NZ927_08180 [Candidatus Calescibacterium sp.]|nr:hypothetical protein [Candidatus Calescibacterium sp.]MCX7734944.1 hypothetical protein [bacterium]MDW8087999.1 hypothetical protein [Candidatus Calescibacterium sp.]
MSEELRLYIIKRFLNEFSFFVPVIYIFSLIVSALRYKSYYTENLILIPLFSIYILPFTLTFSYFISLSLTIRDLREKLNYLKVFGLSNRNFLRFIFLLSFLSFVLSVSVAFVLSPKAFYLIEENLVSSLKIQKRKNREFVVWGNNLLFAKNIEIKKGIIIAENGFLFDGERTVKFEKIKLQIRSPKSRFGKDIAELLSEEDEKGKKEVIYISSTFFSQVSCSPSIFNSVAYLLCNPVLILLSKLLRDSLTSDKFLYIAALVHTIAFTVSLVMIRAKRFEK